MARHLSIPKLYSASTKPNIEDELTNYKTMKLRDKL